MQTPILDERLELEGIDAVFDAMDQGWGIQMESSSDDEYYRTPSALVHAEGTEYYYDELEDFEMSNIARMDKSFCEWSHHHGQPAERAAKEWRSRQRGRE